MVKLADFGIAKAAEQSDITKVGSVLGTAAYLAPEQARGEPAGPASDMYALGVVAYQLLAGRLPYDAASLTDLARLQESGPPPRLDELTPDVSPALAAAVARALHRDPAQRYADAAEMETALRDGLRGRAPATAADWAAEEDTAATRVLSGTSTTSAMPRTSQSPPRRRLEPIDEPPTAAPGPAAAAAARRPAPARPSAARCSSACCRARTRRGRVRGVQAIDNGGGGQSVQLREDVRGGVDDAVDELRGLIEDNTGN